MGQGAVIRADVLRGGEAVVVVSDPEGARIRDWGSVLLRVGGGQTRVLARGVYHASRPLASVDGLVYVERGEEGAMPSPAEVRQGKLRTDGLRIDAVDPNTGAARMLFASSGYTLHIAGEWKDELIVYRVAFEGAELLGIERGSGKVRKIAPLFPFAREFAVDRAGGAIWMTNRDDHDSHVWVVERVDLVSGARARSASSRDATPPVPEGPWLADVR
jgi:hypothetical protein